MSVKNAATQKMSTASNVKLSVPISVAQRKLTAETVSVTVENFAAPRILTAEAVKLSVKSSVAQRQLTVETVSVPLENSAVLWISAI